MSVPNIEMIAASLRKCSLRGGRAVLSPPTVGSPPAVEEEEEVTVELNSEVALPYQWEQCLDIKTGEIYFINRKDGTRTTKDPRLAGCYAEEADYSETTDDESDDSTTWDGDDEGGGGGGSGFGSNYFGTTDDYSTTGETSSSTAYSPGEATSSAAAAIDPPVLVAAGCRSCFMYFMVPKLDFACPKCGGRLLHLGRDGGGGSF